MKRETILVALSLMCLAACSSQNGALSDLPAGTPTAKIKIQMAKPDGYDRTGFRGYSIRVKGGYGNICEQGEMVNLGAASGTKSRSMIETEEAVIPIPADGQRYVVEINAALKFGVESFDATFNAKFDFIPEQDVEYLYVLASENEGNKMSGGGTAFVNFVGIRKAGGIEEQVNTRIRDFSPNRCQ